MLELIGLTLPQAVGIAASPFPIIAAIIILMAPNSRRTGAMFMLGWFLGILVATTVFSFVTLAAVSADTGGSAQPVLGWFKIALGALLVLLAVRQWRKRPEPGAAAQMPKWLSRVDGMGAGGAFGLAFGLASVNPKNLIMAATAGSIVGASRDALGDSALVLVVFTLIAAASVAVPVIAALLAPQASAGVLAAFRTWLLANNATIMSVLLVVLAAQNFGAGLSLM